ncbi:MAG: hypothetical protein QOK47_265, partial [Actinomycetota bacterium]|nr:hypothetical protein [Actinomycetota bacterium]
MRRGRAFFIQSALVVLFTTLVPGPAWANHGDCIIDLSPETNTNDLGDTHTLTATLRPAGTDPNVATSAVCASHGDVKINFEVSTSGSAAYSPSSVDASNSGTNDLTCTIDNNDSACTVSYVRTTPGGEDMVIGAIEDAPSVTDGVEVTWVAPAAIPAFLNVTPETDTNSPRTQHSLTATVRSSNGSVISGATVDVEVIFGPNQDVDGDDNEPDLSCTTGGNGTCSVSYTDDSASGGNVDTICAWIDSDKDDSYDAGGANEDGGDCDAEADAETEDSAQSGADTFGNDVTDRVTKT